MKTLKGNEDFLRINQKVNIFDIVSCKEEQASQIIAWLLNPREAHGFGNHFFKAMLNELKDKNIKIFKGTNEVKNKNKEKDLLIRDWQKKYHNIIIQKEYCINSKCKDENGRIDILLCSEDAKTLFVIENKYGAKEHNKQTKIYYDYFSKYKKYNICYIYLDINGYYEDDEKELTDSEHWNIINYDWIVDFLKENLTGSYVDKIIRDIYIEFTGNYDEEPYFDRFFNQKTKLYKDYKDDISNYENPFPYHPGYSDEEKFQFALYNDFYSVLSECSNWDNLIDKFKSSGYLVDNHGDNFINITLKNVDNKYREFNKNKKTKKWWPFYINITYHKPKDDEKGKAYLEIKLICTNEYINDDKKMRSVQKKLKEIFDDNKIKNKIEQKIVPFKSGETIKQFFLKKVIKEDFDFSEKKMSELCTTVNKDFTDKMNKMDVIFFPKNDISE